MSYGYYTRFHKFLLQLVFFFSLEKIEIEKYTTLIVISFFLL